MVGQVFEQYLEQFEIQQGVDEQGRRNEFKQEKLMDKIILTFTKEDDWAQVEFKHN